MIRISATLIKLVRKTTSSGAPPQDAIKQLGDHNPPFQYYNSGSGH